MTPAMKLAGHLRPSLRSLVTRAGLGYIEMSRLSSWKGLSTVLGGLKTHTATQKASFSTSRTAFSVISHKTAEKQDIKARPSAPFNLVSAFFGKGKPKEHFKIENGNDTVLIQNTNTTQQSNFSCGIDGRACGEDAYFVYEGENRLVLGVADGVGGWAEVGVDPAIFAWTLMDNAGIVAKQDSRKHPSDILDKAYTTLLQDGKVEAGSSTACIAAIDKASGVLECANLGDSGLVILRAGKVVWHSPDQQHYFNAPYQLAVVPKSMQGGGSIVDKPSDADCFELQLQKGDIVVLGTDGLFDNLFDSQIEAELKPFCNKEGDFKAKEAAATLVTKAVELANNGDRMSPFAANARSYGYSFRGGKVDDVCAVLAYVG